MKVLRTADHCFDNLPGFAFEPHYLEIDSGEGTKLRVHYLDEGPRDGQVVLLMHGEPSWCYLYRKMIPVIVAAGYRAIAIDLVGFGRSDKPTERSDYSYARHVDWMTQVVKQLDLQNVTLVAQDWGGLIGLRILAENVDRFARVVVANTMLPDGTIPMPESFNNWREFSQSVPELPVGKIIATSSVTEIDAAVIAAYDAPFPDETYKAGAREFPVLVPASMEHPGAADNRAAWQVLEKFDKPFLTAFSDSDPITKGGDRIFQSRVPGTKDQPHTTIEQAGHFLQEEQGEALATVVVDFIRRCESS